VKVLVLGLGNELLSDDAVGILTVRRLSEELKGQADFAESAVCGLALLDYFIGYDKAIIIDAIKTSQNPPGTVMSLDAEHIPPVAAPSPHYAGLPELLAISMELKIDFPQEIRIFALEVNDLHTIGGAITPAVVNGMGELVKVVARQLREWNMAYA